MNARQLLTRMPEVLDAEAAAGTDAVIQYNISQPTYQVLREGELTVHEGVAPDPDLTVTIGDDDLVRLFRGELNPMTAFMTGKVKVEGNVMLAQKLVGFVDRAKLESLA